MDTQSFHARRLRQIKWLTIGLAAIFLAVVEVYYFIRGVPLVDDVIDWLIGMAGATLLIVVSFRIVENLQRRLQHEISERQRAEESLREAHGELERRVQERTAELIRANEALQRRATQVALISEISAKIAAELDIVEVFKRATGLIQESFGYHHVTLFTVDQKRREAVLRSAAGPYATRMPADYRLKLTDGLVGWTATHGATRLANDVGTDPHYYRGPLADEMTRAELCTPIRIGEETVGVIDVQSSQVDAFDDSDRIVMETLADQIAVAIRNARLFEELHSSRARLRRLAQQVVSAQEGERRRLSRELHDEAGQAMTALKIGLELIQADLPDRVGSLRQRMHEAIALTDATMEQLRLLAQDLRPPALEAVGLGPTLEEFCKEFTRRTRISIAYAGSNLLVLPDAVSICLYRFLQEALTNVAKHANASRVCVELRYAGEMITLSVEDDGQGFDKQAVLSAPGRNPGIGLLGMQERIELLGGRLEVASQPGQGTCLTAHIPWQEDA